jgi:hypothetical protein
VLNEENATRENQAAQTPSLEQPPPLKANIVGIRDASPELYDACLRIVEVANAILELPPDQPLGNDLTLRLLTTRMCAQQALDHARRNS